MIRNGPPKADATNDEKLKVYALYKQASEGDVTGGQPWAVQFEARAKWDAWNALKGMSKDEAKKQYVALVDSTSPGWEGSSVMAGYTS